MKKARLDIEPADVGVELGKASAECIVVEGLRLQVQTFEDAIALLRVGLRQGGSDIGLSDVQAAAFDQE